MVIMAHLLFDKNIAGFRIIEYNFLFSHELGTMNKYFVAYIHKANYEDKLQHYLCFYKKPAILLSNIMMF